MKRYLLLTAIGFAVIVTVIVFCINNTKSGSIAVVDKIEMTCDININESHDISAYTLTVAGYLTSGEYADGIPPIVFQNFDLITDGTIESIENIVLFAFINGNTEAVKYDFAYAVLEETGIDG